MHMLRQAVFVAVTLGLAGATAATVAYLRAPPTPPQVSHPDELDLGEQPFGAVAVGRFRVANSGGAPLRLDRFATSCSCAGVDVEQNGKFRRVAEVEVPAGGDAELVVRVAAGAKVGTRQSVEIAFATNDPARPVCVVEAVIPRIEGGVYATPAAAVFGTLPVGDRGTRVVHLYDNRIATRRIAAVTSSRPDRFAVRLVPVTPGNEQPPHATAGRHVADVEVTPQTAAAGSLAGVVEVRLADEDRSPDRIDVLGDVVGPVTCRPDRLVFPRVAAGKPCHHAEVHVAGRDGQPVAVSVAAAPAGVTASVAPAADGGGGTVVTVRCTPGVDLSAPLRLSVHGPDGRETAVVVPVTSARGEP